VQRYGVIRVVDCEIRWLTGGGKFREFGELTWRADREQAYQRASRVRGLVVQISEEVNQKPPQSREDARQRVFNIIPLPEQRATEAKRLEIVEKLRAFRQSLSELR
jgi:hypothetical protein